VAPLALTCRRTIESELRMSLEDVFESVDAQPLATASIAQAGAHGSHMAGCAACAAHQLACTASARPLKCSGSALHPSLGTGARCGAARQRQGGGDKGAEAGGGGCADHGWVLWGVGVAGRAMVGALPGVGGMLWLRLLPAVPCLGPTAPAHPCKPPPLQTSTSSTSPPSSWNSSHPTSRAPR
jgi:hypothetical protein